MSEINNQNEKSIYEISYHIIPSVDETEILAYASNIRSLIEEKGGIIVSEELPKTTVLAYEISKVINTKKQNFNKAHFGWIKFEMESSRIAEIKDEIENIPSILRFLIIKTVRENTMHTPKAPVFRKEVSKEESPGGIPERPKASEAEIDKSIEELIVDQTL